CSRTGRIPPGFATASTRRRSTSRRRTNSVTHTRVSALREAELPELSKEEAQRYARHLRLPNVTSIGQRRLKASRVLVVGAGGLGSPVALYLAAAGVGRIGLVDFDDGDISDVEPQILHGKLAVGA